MRRSKGERTKRSVRVSSGGKEGGEGHETRDMEEHWQCDGARAILGE